MTEEDFEKFKETVDQISIDIALGKIATVELFGGPLDGASRMIEVKEGIPIRTSVDFVVPEVFRIGVPVDHARYEWSVSDGAFKYAGGAFKRSVIL